MSNMHTGPWGNPALSSRIVELARTGKSSKEIAAALTDEFPDEGPFTKSTVVGRLRRVGVRLADSKRNRVSKSEASDQRASLCRIRDGDAFAPEQEPVGCRYIHGDVRGGREAWRYCQKKTVDKSLYCDHHERVCVMRRTG
jgi:hypothetical protein